jgi:transposase-like protein
MKNRRKFSSAFKAKVVLAAIKERESIRSLSSNYELTPEQISKWKHEAIKKLSLVYSMESPEQKSDKEIRRLKEIIGYLHVENDFLKKTL